MRSRRKIRRRSSTTSRFAVDVRRARVREGDPAISGIRLIGRGPCAGEGTTRAFRGGALAVAKDLMYQQEIRDAVRDAYGSIARGAGEVVAGRLYGEEELAELPAGAATGRSASAIPSDTRSSGLARWSWTSGRAVASTRSWPRDASGRRGQRSVWKSSRRWAIEPARTRPRPASTAGRNSCWARWSRSRCLTPRSTSCSRTES